MGKIFLSWPMMPVTICFVIPQNQKKIYQTKMIQLKIIQWLRCCPRGQHWRSMLPVRATLRICERHVTRFEPTVCRYFALKYNNRLCHHLCCTIAETNLVDVKLGDCGIEHKIEIVKHRHHLHRSTFTGQLSERHNVREIDRRIGNQLRFDMVTRFQLLRHAPV